MLQAFLCALCRELDHAALTSNRLNRADPQFNRLLYGEIHAITGRNGLCQQQLQRRFIVQSAHRSDFAAHLLLADMLNLRVIILSVAIEQHHAIAHLQTQYFASMQGGMVGQLNQAAQAKSVALSRVAIESGGTHKGQKLGDKIDKCRLF